MKSWVCVQSLDENPHPVLIQGENGLGDGYLSDKDLRKLIKGPVKIGWYELQSKTAEYRGQKAPISKSIFT